MRSTVPSFADLDLVHGHAFGVVGSDAEFLAVALPYLDAGLRAGELVTLAASLHMVDLLSRELGEPARLIRLDPQVGLLGARPPDVVIAMGRHAEEAAARGARYRGLAEVDFGAEPADWREGLRFESAFNQVATGLPAALLCIYDRRHLSRAVVESAAITHPCRLADDHWAENPTFRDPAVFVPSLPWPREPLEETAPVLVVYDAPRLPDLRHQLAAVITVHVRDPEQQEDLRLAASEIAANAFRHGQKPVSARMWVDDWRMVCEITDSGTSFDDQFAGFVPAHGPDLGRGGMGLWLARKLWDHVDLVRRPDGFTVRLSTRLR